MYRSPVNATTLRQMKYTQHGSRACWGAGDDVDGTADGCGRLIRRRSADACCVSFLTAASSRLC